MIEYNISEQLFTLHIPCSDIKSINMQKIEAMIKCWQMEALVASVPPVTTEQINTERAKLNIPPLGASEPPPRPGDKLDGFLDELDPVVVEKLLRGQASNQENLNVAEFETFLTWTVAALRQQFELNRFDFDGATAALRGSGLVVRDFVMQSVIRILAETGRLQLHQVKVGGPLAFTVVDKKV